MGGLLPWRAVADPKISEAANAAASEPSANEILL